MSPDEFCQRVRASLEETNDRRADEPDRRRVLAVLDTAAGAAGDAEAFEGQIAALAGSADPAEARAGGWLLAKWRARLTPSRGAMVRFRRTAPIAGGADEAQLARWMEQAASHQTRALAWLRRARDPSAGPLPTAQHRDLLLRALEHLLGARRLLLRAQEATDNPDLLTILESHLARLDGTVENTERLLQGIEVAEG